MKNDTIPGEVREKLADTIEEIGSAMGLLREAHDDVKRGNVMGGKMSASDALEIISKLESTFALIAADLARWSEFEDAA